ncbi:hypothetical protein HK098_004649 [Nowakowskiella sp. JEL0407]|nr:hypothetical protein HK098_004649 [Nowakowskiella sp. JEL0407]
MSLTQVNGTMHTNNGGTFSAINSASRNIVDLAWRNNTFYVPISFTTATPVQFQIAFSGSSCALVFFDDFLIPAEIAAPVIVTTRVLTTTSTTTTNIPTTTTTTATTTTKTTRTTTTTSTTTTRTTTTSTSSTTTASSALPSPAAAIIATSTISIQVSTILIVKIDAVSPSNQVQNVPTSPIADPPLSPLAAPPPSSPSPNQPIIAISSPSAASPLPNAQPPAGAASPSPNVDSQPAGSPLSNGQAPAGAPPFVSISPSNGNINSTVDGGAPHSDGGIIGIALGSSATVIGVAALIAFLFMVRRQAQPTPVVNAPLLQEFEGSPTNERYRSRDY